MRYDPDHKMRTHRRIVRNASRQLRTKGLNGPAVTTLMKASGLTHGGFYKHFGSREDLVIEAIEESLQELRDRLVAAAQQALADAGWKPQTYEDQTSTGVMIGSGIGGLTGIAETAIVLKERGPRAAQRRQWRAPQSNRRSRRHDWAPSGRAQSTHIRRQD